MYFSNSTLGPRFGAILVPGTFVGTNFVKDYQAKPDTIFQASEPSSSEDEFF